MTRIGSIGDCKLIDWDADASFYVSLALLKIRKGYSPAFISHYSESAFFQKEVELNSLQSAIPKKINLGPISEVRIRIPADLDEQTAIASILTDMDAEIAALEEKVAKSHQIKQGMMQELLTGKVRLV
jgi:type I restriction enzyme S subunit